jgi:hypothetical protein
MVNKYGAMIMDRSVAASEATTTKRVTGAWGRRLFWRDARNVYILHRLAVVIRSESWPLRVSNGTLGWARGRVSWGRASRDPHSRVTLLLVLNARMHCSYYFRLLRPGLLAFLCHMRHVLGRKEAEACHDLSRWTHDTSQDVFSADRFTLKLSLFLECALPAPCIIPWIYAVPRRRKSV